jgi:tetrahydromethanopterin S-methyltransferase subunit H
MNMFVFKKDQQSFDFGGITIGGQPGENPTVLIGGLFFKGQAIMKDTRKGIFDEALTKNWINTGLSMVEKTGHPLIIQAYGRTPTAMEKHLSWLADNFEGPFMFESTNAKARIRAIEYCDESGLSNRAIYNSINLSMTADEKDVLTNSSLKMAVVLGWSPRATTLPDRMETIRDVITLSNSLEIEKILVDPATMPVGAGYGLEYRTTLAIKSELGLPTCLGPHNAPSAWRFIRQTGLDDESTLVAALIASTVSAQLFATDSVMFGSMIHAKEVFTSVALTANAIATAVAESNRALDIDRPLFSPPTYD